MHPNVQSEAEGSLTNLHDHLIPGAPISLQNPLAFTFQDISFASAAGAPVYAAGLPDPLTENTT
jgi:hypothetical protein